LVLEPAASSNAPAFEAQSTPSLERDRCEEGRVTATAVLAEAAIAESPWIAPIAGVLGAAVGGLVGVLGASLADRRRFRREDTTRWLDARRTAYARMVAAGINALRVTSTIVGARLTAGDTPIDFRPLVDQMMTAQLNIGDAYADAHLLAGTDAQRALDEFTDEVNSVFRFTVVLPTSQAEFDSMVRDTSERMRQAREKLVRAARHEMGLEIWLPAIDA
jgi:hypothetical protein